MSTWPFSDKLMLATTEIAGEKILVYEGYDFTLLNDACTSFFSTGKRMRNAYYPPNNKIDLKVQDYDGTFDEWEQVCFVRGETYEP